MLGLNISEAEFKTIQDLLYSHSGISLSESKRSLVCGRLAKRLKHYGFTSYKAYFAFLVGEQENGELQVAIDLLTTNETHFFREPKHFDFLRNSVLPVRETGKTFRVWSAACSSGQEAFTVAMVLADHIVDGAWNVVGSDLSSRVLAVARRGKYPIEKSEEIPAGYLKKYCLRGVDGEAGSFLVGRKIREKIDFRQINLINTLPEIGQFDVIFLRNAMIYFNHDIKRRVVDKILPRLKKKGFLFIGQSESLNGVSDKVRIVAPSIYQRCID